MEAAGAGEGVEQAGADRALGEDGLEGIEEGATGGFGREGAEQTEAEVVLIGETGAVTGQLARDREVQQGFKKGIGERGGVLWKGHNNHKPATLTINDASGNAGNRRRFPVADGPVPRCQKRCRKPRQGDDCGKFKPRRRPAAMRVAHSGAMIYDGSRTPFF